MKPTSNLHDLGQSLWLDNITRELLNSGTLQRYIDEFSVTGLTSNPTIFDHAIKNSTTYDADISRKAFSTQSAEDLFFELALADLTRAAELFQPVFARTDGVDGWVSLEVSPLLAHDTASTLAAARVLHRRGGKPNVFIKIPGTAEGLPAIEAAIFAGVPVNVTLLFSREQYVAAAEAYLRGIERRIEAGLNPAVASVASLFVSRWDVAISGKVPGELDNRLGIAIAQRAHQAYRELLASARFQGAANAGARAQRLLWASTGTKDPRASDILYVKALAAPFTVNTMPEGTLEGSDMVSQQDSNGNLAVKLLRTFAAQTEALQRYRGKGQQKVTVEHVHVHTGGQAIVGSVSQSGGGRDSDQNRGQPHAPENAGAITFAPGTTLPSADKARDAVPVASGRR
jgi:transaldolase